jgi:hypothetical protein
MSLPNDPVSDSLFEAGSPEATQHNKLKFYENRLLVEATSAVTRLRSAAAIEHLQRGFVIRHMMMQKSRFAIRERTIDREEPLDPYLATELSIHLNSYYTNLRGALDNLAWAATYELALLAQPDETEKNSRQFCTLEGKKFQKALETMCPQMVAQLKALGPWMTEIKRFRDPAAHRIPLTLVSAILTPDDQRASAELNARAMEALEAEDLATWASLKGKANRLGKFIPILAAPRGLNGELIVGPNQIALDQRIFLRLARPFVTECLTKAVSEKLS